MSPRPPETDDLCQVTLDISEDSEVEQNSMSAGA